MKFDDGLEGSFEKILQEKKNSTRKKKLYKKKKIIQEKKNYMEKNSVPRNYISFFRMPRLLVTS